MNHAAGLYRAGERGAALGMDMGTGKSGAAIGVATAMARRGSIDWALVVTPTAVATTWTHATEGEIALNSAHVPQRAVLIDGPVRERLPRLRREIVRAKADGVFLWAVMGVSFFERGTMERIPNRRTGAPTKKLRPTQIYLEHLKALAPFTARGFFILDESTGVKHPESRRSRSVRLLAWLFAWRTIMSGDVQPRDPLDLWAQFEVLKRGALGYDHFEDFQERYALRELRHKPGGGRYWAITGWQHLDELRRRVAAWTYFCKAKDCQKLPPNTVHKLPVTMTAEQRRHVQQLATDMVAELDSGEKIDGRSILARLAKVSQILGGHVKVSDADGQPTGEVYHYDPNPKMQVLRQYLDMVRDANEQAVIVCRYTAEVAAITEAFDAARFDGKVRDPEAQLRAFTSGRKRVLVGQYAKISKGLNLAMATHLILYSLTDDGEHFHQAKKRIHRQGQHFPTNEVYLLAEGRRGGETHDHGLLQLLREKRHLSDIVTGDTRALREELGRII